MRMSISHKGNKPTQQKNNEKYNIFDIVKLIKSCYKWKYQHFFLF